MNYLIILFTIPFYCLWRRWFGSSEIWWKVPRAVKCVIFLLVTLCISYIITKDYIHSIIFSGCGYLFFCLAIGPAFDIGRDGMPDDELKKRYNQYIWHYLPDILLKNHKYGYLYDMIWLGCRFAIPAIVISIIPFINWEFCFIGMIFSPIYALCWSLYEKENWLLQKIPYTNGKPTAFAEYIVGATFGLWPLFIG